MKRKVEKAIRILRKYSDGDLDLLTILMHVAAALFIEMAEREGREMAKASLVNWFKKIAAMCDGEFDIDSSKN